jgi:hypothetical protein
MVRFFFDSTLAWASQAVNSVHKKTSSMLLQINREVVANIFGWFVNA